MSNKPAINLKDPETIGLISPPYKGAARCQYGHYYDEGGSYLFSVPEEVEMAVKLGHTRKAASIVEHDEVAEQDVTAGDVDPVEEPDGDDFVDLSGWAAGDATYPFFKVKAAIAARYGVTPANRKQAEEVIRDGGPQHDI